MSLVSASGLSIQQLQQKIMLREHKENENKDPKALPTPNSPSLKSRKLSPKPFKSDNIVLAVEEGIANGQCDLIHLLLSDPLLKELNISLEKEAEQQKKSKLLQNFPLRYKNLVHTQMLYKTVQAQLKEYQKESQEIIQQLQKDKQTLEDQLVFLKTELSHRDELLILMKEQHSSTIASLREENRVRIEQIEKAKEEQLAEQQRKVAKVSTEKEHIMQFLEEMKEQSDNLKLQNSRIVQLLTQKDTEISQLHSTLADSQAQYHNAKQSFMAQLIQLELDSSQQIQKITKAHEELSLVAEGLKARLRQCEDEIIEMLRQKEDEETNHFNQMQEIRSKLLETVREKNNLEEEIESLRGQHEQKVTQLEDELRRRQREREAREQEMELIKIKQQSNLCELSQKLIRVEASKQSGIQQLSNKILQQNDNKIRLEQQLVSLSKSREELIAETIALKNQLQKYKATISESTSAHKKTEIKNSEIQGMIGQLKKQLLNFNQIIQQKDLKIQQYRRQIYALRSRVNQLNCQHDQRGLEIVALQQNITAQSNMLDRLIWEAQQAREKETVLIQQLEQQKRTHQVSKEDKQSQTEANIAITSQQEHQKLNKILEKTQLKYENAVEELRAYQKEYQGRCREQEQLIEELSRTSRQQSQTIEQLKSKLEGSQEAIGKYQGEIADLKESMNQNMYEASQIQQVFDAKINQLKTFYEEKIGAESTKYKGVISLLKQEMSQLYQEIDLKKTIEAEIFKDIVSLDPSSSTTAFRLEHDFR